MAERGRYLFAVTRGLDPAALARRPGLRGRPRSRCVEHRGLQAVVSDVDLESSARRGCAATSRTSSGSRRSPARHDEVVQAVAAHGPTAPLRLATICLDDAGVRAGSTSGTTRWSRCSTGSRAAASGA